MIIVTLWPHYNLEANTVKPNHNKKMPPDGTSGGGGDGGRVLINYDHNTTAAERLSSASVDPAAIWSKISPLLAATTSRETYRLHFAAARPLRVERGRLIVVLPSTTNILWIRARLAGVVARAVAAAGFEGLDVDWRVR